MDGDQLLTRVSRDEINSMPLRHYEGPIEIVRTLPKWEAVKEELKNENVLGFDTETRPTFKKGRINSPALIQIATSKTVYLVQLAWLPFSAHIAEILARPDIIKTGVGINDDMTALGKLHPFSPAGCVDLGLVAKTHNIPNQGLRTLAASLFGWRISKGSQCSNWSSRNLSSRQIAYAATDAWVGRLIYLKLQDLGIIPNAISP